MERERTIIASLLALTLASTLASRLASNFELRISSISSLIRKRARSIVFVHCLKIIFRQGTSAEKVQVYQLSLPNDERRASPET